MFLSNNINCKDCFVHIINQAPILQSSINQVNHKPWQKIIIVVILATGNEHDLIRNIDGALRRIQPDDDRSPPRDRRRSSRHHSQVSLSVSAKKLRKRKVQTCKNSTASGCLKFEMWDCCHELLSKGSGQHRSMDFCWQQWARWETITIVDTTSHCFNFHCECE